MPSDDVIQHLIDAIDALVHRVSDLERKEYGAHVTAGILTAYDRVTHTATVTIGGVSYAGVPISAFGGAWTMVIGSTVNVLSFSPAALATSLVIALHDVTGPPPNPVDGVSGHDHSGGIDQGPVLP
jgi:hypothetical protein